MPDQLPDSVSGVRIRPVRSQEQSTSPHEAQCAEVDNFVQSDTVALLLPRRRMGESYCPGRRISYFFSTFVPLPRVLSECTVLLVRYLCAALGPQFTLLAF